MRILVLEDCDVVWEIMRRHLIGMKVDRYACPDEVIGKGLDQYDVLISDNSMPEMNGDEFISKHWDKPALLWSSTPSDIRMDIIPTHVYVTHKENIHQIEGLMIGAIEKHNRITMFHMKHRENKDDSPIRPVGVPVHKAPFGTP